MDYLAIGLLCRRIYAPSHWLIFYKHVHPVTNLVAIVILVRKCLALPLVVHLIIPWVRVWRATFKLPPNLEFLWSPNRTTGVEGGGTEIVVLSWSPPLLVQVQDLLKSQESALCWLSDSRCLGLYMFSPFCTSRGTPLSALDHDGVVDFLAMNQAFHEAKKKVVASLLAYRVLRSRGICCKETDLLSIQHKKTSHLTSCVSVVESIQRTLTMLIWSFKIIFGVKWTLESNFWNAYYLRAFMLNGWEVHSYVINLLSYWLWGFPT